MGDVRQSPKPAHSAQRHLGVRWALAFSLLVLLGVGGLCYRSLRATFLSDQRQNHTYEVIDEFNQLLSALKDAETGQRGYLLTGNSSYLSPYNDALKQIGRHFQRARTLTADDSDQQKRLDQIAALKDTKLAIIKQTIDLRSRGDLAGAMKIVDSNAGENVMNQIRSLVAAAQNEEHELLLVRGAAEQADIQRNMDLLSLGGTLALVIILGCFLLLRRYQHELLRHQNHLARLVDERTAALEQERSFLRTLTDASPSLIMVKDADGRYLLANRKAAEFYDMTPEELIGKTSADLDLVLHERRPFIFEQDRAVMESGRPSRMDLHLKGVDQQYHWHDAIRIPLFNALGQCDTLLIVATDVTQRKQAEEEVRLNREWLRVMLSSIGDGVIATDAQARIAFINPVAEALTGWAADEAQGQIAQSVFQIINEKTRQPGEDIVGRVLREQKMVALANHTSLVTRKGREIPIEDSAAPILDASGALLGMVLVFHDVTERRRSMEALQRQASLINLSPDAIIVRNQQGLISFWSDGAQTMYGWTRPEAIGQTSDDLLATQFTEPLEQILETIRQAGRWSGELVHRTKDGRQLTVQSWWLAEYDEQGQLAQILESNVDITERKRQEVALAEIAEARRLSLEAAELGAWDYRFTTGEVFWDARCRDMWGIHEGGQIDYNAAIDRIHPEDRAGVDEAVRRVIEGFDDGAYHREFRVIWPDGSEHWIASHGHVYFDGEGEARKTVRFTGVNMDITERRLAEMRLRQSAQFPEENPNPVLRVGPRGELLYANAAGDNLLRQLGWEPGQIMPEVIHEGLRRAIDSKTAQTIEILSEARIFEFSCTPVAGETYFNLYGGDVTTRKQAERELLDSREWFRVTLNSIGDAVISSDTDGRVTFMNHVAQVMTGWPQEEALGQPIQTIFNIFNEQTRQAAEDVVGRVLRERRIVTLANHTLLIDRGGNEIPIEDSAAPILSRDSELLGAVLVFHDVTQRHRAQEALRQSEAKLRTITESTDDMIFMKDRQGRMVMVNPAAMRTIGLPVEQILGRTSGELFNDSVLAEQVVANDRRVMETGKAETIEELRQTSEGTRVFLSNKTPWRDAEGQVIGLIGVSRDITERKRDEDELRRAKEEWETTFDSVPDLIAVLDGEHRVVRANRAMAERLGVAPETCIGLHCYEAVHGTDEPIAGCPHNCTMHDACEHTAEVFEPKLGGDFLVSTTPLFDAEGHMTGSVHVARDITERKRAEEELRRYSERLAILAETGEALLNSENPQSVVESLCTKVMEHLDCHAFFNFLVDEQAGKLHLNACAGIPPEEAARIEYLEYGVAVCGCAAQQNCRIVAEHIPTTSDPRTELVKSYGIKAYACHPLVGEGGQVLGTLSFGTRDRETFSDEDLSLMKAVADQVAVAMSRIRAQAAVRESEKRYRSLFSSMTESFAIQEMIHDEQGKICDFRYLDVNPAFERLAGVGRERIVGRTHREIFQEGDPHWIEILGEVALAGKSFQFERYSPALRRHLDIIAYQNVPGQCAVVLMDVTERKRTQEVLREREEEFRAIFEASAAGIAELEAGTGRFRLVNRRFCEITGYSAEELMQFTFSEITHPDDLQLDQRETWRALSGEREGYEYEKRYIHKNGQTVWVLIAGRLVRHANGTPLHTIASVIDITQRKKADEALKRYLWRQTRLVEASARILARHEIEELLEVIADAVREIADAPYACAAHGLDNGQFRRRALSLAPDHEQAASELSRALSHGALLLRTAGKTPTWRLTRKQLIEHPLWRKSMGLAETGETAEDGSASPTLGAVLGARLLGADGLPSGMILAGQRGGEFSEEDEAALRQLALIASLALQHLDARRQLEAARDELEQRVRERTADLVESNRITRMISECNEAVMRCESEDELMREICRIITEVGDYCIAWVGYAENDAMRSVRPVAFVGFGEGYLEQAQITWADTERGRGPTGAAIRTGKIQIGHSFLTDPQLLPWREQAIANGYQSSIALPMMADGEAFGALTIYGAEPMAFSETQVKVLAELADNLSFGLVALRTRQALQDRSLQLRELASQLTQAEEQERRRLADLLHDDLQQVLVGAKCHLAILRKHLAGANEKNTDQVEQLLDEAVEKSRSLSHELCPPILQQRGLVAALEWLARRMQEQHQLNVIIESEENAEPDDHIMRTFLFRSVQELLLNILKHAGTNEAQVRLRKENGEIYLSVSDQGRGFEISETGGISSGMGLFSIRERASYLGGRIEVQSSVGRGSCFSLFVPHHAPPSPQAERPAHSSILPLGAQIANAKPAHLANLRILLADDHKVMRQGLRTLLTDESGLEIVGEASDGREAVELALQLHPAVVIMDVAMPEIDGVEATRRIKAVFPEMRVIGLSMFEESEMAQKMLAARAEAYFSKAGPTEELLAAIRGRMD